MALHIPLGRSEDWTTRLFVLLGLALVTAAAAAFVVAGVQASDAFTPGLGRIALAHHHGVSGSTVAWAGPLALAGIAALFSGIALAVARIRINIGRRADALSSSLPRVIQPNNRARTGAS